MSRYPLVLLFGVTAMRSVAVAQQPARASVVGLEMLESLH
jgi:hypothetical protein